MKSRMFGHLPRRGRQVFCLSILSLGLFWAGIHGFTRTVSSLLMTVVSPLHYAVDAPVRAVRWVAGSAKTQNNLLTENARLRAHQLLLESKVQRLQALQRENKQLRALRHSASQLTVAVDVTRLLAISLNPALNEWLINSGSNQGVKVGQPVLDAYGVVGQVVKTAANTAKVLLLTDKKGAISVVNTRTGERVIAVGGRGLNTLELKSLPKTMDVRAGDQYVSSGLAQHFPFGYPVGTAMNINRTDDERFLSVRLKVAAHLSQSNELLLVTSDLKAPLKHRAKEA